MRATYLDSSAIVKLVAREAETDALREYLAERPARVSSALAKTEVLRALLPAGTEAVQRGEAVLGAIELIAVTPELLGSAARILPATIRSLDAIHLASASALEEDLESLVTYDKRMLEGARRAGLTVAAPGA